MALTRVAVLGALLAALAYYFYSKPSTYLPWHATPQWEHFLSIYDDRMARHFVDCNSSLLDTAWGRTQFHACGDPSHPPLLMMHGAGSNANIYGPWLLPKLRETHYAVAIDYPCDVGRSIPKDGNPDNCPAAAEDMVQWVEQVVDGLQLSKPVSMIGYSYGCQVAFLTARERPQLVDKLILMAPAGVFAPIIMSTILRGFVYYLWQTDWTAHWFFSYMAAGDEFVIDKEGMQEILATRDVGATLLKIPADSFEDEVLSEVIAKHSTLLVIGQEEKFINATLAVQRAQQAGAAVKLYANAGHLMLAEEPARSLAIDDVAAFLQE